MPSDDTLSWRFLREPVPDGPYAGRILGLIPMLEEYYADRGWDGETGMPKDGVLEGLGLGEVGKDLERSREARNWKI